MNERRQPPAQVLEDAPGEANRAPSPAAAARAAKPAVKTDGAVVSPTERTRALAETVVASFLDRMTMEAVRRGGRLTIRDIRDLRREFEMKTERLRAIFEKSFEEYVRVRERAVWDQKREYPFDRQIVEKFSHLFPSPGGLSLADGAVSRRILPGFFLAVNLMLGEEAMEEFQQKCRDAVDRLKAEQQKDFTWDDVQGNKEIDNLTLDAVVALAPHFDDIDRRAEWFIDVINSHLAPADVGREGEATVDWQMTEETFWIFLNALFSDVRRSMSTEIGRLHLTQRYGAETTADLAEIVKILEEEVVD